MQVKHPTKNQKPPTASAWQSESLPSLDRAIDLPERIIPLNINTRSGAPSQLSPSRSGIFPALAIIFLGVTLSLTGFILLKKWERTSLENELSLLGEEYRDALQDQIRRGLEILQALEAFYAGSHQIKRDEFKTFAQIFLSNHPEIAALVWVPHVSDSDRVAFEKEARKEGPLDFRIFERDHHGAALPASNREDHFPIIYIEPFERYRSSLGFDYASDPLRLELMKKARDTGRIVASPWVRLPGLSEQAADRQLGFWVYLPIYRSNAPRATMEERRQNLVGFAVAAFRVKEIIRLSLKPYGTKHLEVYFSGSTVHSKRGPLYLYKPDLSAAKAHLVSVEKLGSYAGLQWSKSFEISGQTWTILCRPTPEFFEIRKKWESWTVLVVGLLLTTLTGGYLLITSTRTQHIERLVSERTADLAKANQQLEKDVIERKEAEAILRQTEERFQAILDNTTAVIYIKDTEGRYLLINRQYENLCHISREQVKGKTDYDLFPEEQAAVFRMNDHRVLAQRAPLQFEEMIFENGNLHTYLSIKFPFLDPVGTPYAVCGISTDITERIRAEAAQRELMQKEWELERSKAEREQLELFAFVASHDLQEPLHKIAAFGDLLRENNAAVLDEKGRSYLERMQSATMRMSGLIEDLVKFSRVTTKQEPFEQVALQQIVEQVLRDLELRIKEAQATVEVGELPLLQADKSQMRQLFQNLIVNALKFRKKEKPIRVTITNRDLDQDFSEITIQDNGIGFEQKYADQIFRPFERLHGQSEYQGSGMGLAICQRIVLRHGGKITAKSTVGEGSAFILTLPVHLAVEKSL